MHFVRKWLIWTEYDIYNSGVGVRCTYLQSTQLSHQNPLFPCVVLNRDLFLNLQILHFLHVWKYRSQKTYLGGVPSHHWYVDMMHVNLKVADWCLMAALHWPKTTNIQISVNARTQGHWILLVIETFIVVFSLGFSEYNEAYKYVFTLYIAPSTDCVGCMHMCPAN